MVSEACAVCAKPSSQKCGSCHLVHYCSREHQKEDWKKHKKVCGPFKLVESPELGRHLVATRDFPPGEIIMKEPPLVAGPQQFTVPVCLGCYLVADGTRECTKCGWPVCSVECENSLAHRGECVLTQRRGSKVSIKNFFEIHPMYQCVTVLRCLYLQESDLASWDKLMALESHCEKRKGTERYEADRVAVAKFIRSFFQLEDFSEELILKVCGILQVNGHEVPLRQPPFIAVYERVSMIEHNCRPNCSKTFTNDGQVVVFSTVPISAGQHFSICYTDPLWGTSNRRHHLQVSKFFSCACDRCKDPTELGTYLSSMKCPKCPENFLLPEDPLDDKNAVKCNNCGELLAADKVRIILENVGKDLVALKKGDVKACEHFLSKYKDTVLHPNHYYITDVKLALAQLYGRTVSGGLLEISDEDLGSKMNVCRQLLDVMDTLAPGLTRLRGIVLYELQAAMAEEARRKATNNELEPALLRDRMLEVEKILKEAIDILHHEPSESPEGLMAAQGKRDLRELQFLLQQLYATLGISIL